MLVHPDIVPLRVGAADLARLRVDRADGSVRLTPIEARLLGHLAARSPEPVSRQELLSVVWGYAPGVHTRTVAVTVHTLRAKIEPDPAAPLHVLTIRGEGYRFSPAPMSAPVLLAQLARSASLDPVLRQHLLLTRVAVVGYDDPAAALAMLDAGLPGAQTLRMSLLADLGRLDEAAALLDAALADAAPDARPQLQMHAAGLARRAGDITGAIDGVRSVIASGGPDDLRAQAQIRLGVMLLDQGEIAAGFDVLAAARATLAPLDAPRLLAIAWGEEGLYRFIHATLAEAHEALERAVSCATRAQSLYVERVARAGLALVFRLLGEDTNAERERRRGEALSVARWYEPGLHGFIAKERFAAGEVAEALARIDDGLARHAVRPNTADHALLVALKAVWSGGQLQDVAGVLAAENPSLYRILILRQRPLSEAYQLLFQAA